MFVLFALLGLAWGQECPEATTPTQMETHIDDAFLAFATLDEQGVYDAADDAAADLRCLSSTLDPEGAAAYHRLLGIRTFMEGNADGALLSFQAARAIQPGYELSSKIAPEGGRLARLFESAKDTPDQLTVTFKTPSGLTPYVDGAESNQYSLEFPAVVQYADRSGAVLWTGYLRPGDKPPRELEGAPAVAAAASTGVAVATAPEPKPEDLLLEEDDDLLTTAEALGIEMLDEEPEPEPEPKKSKKDKREAEEAVAMVEEDLDEPLPLDLKPPKEKKAKGGGLNPIWAATIGTGAAAAATFGLSAGMRASFDQNPTATKYHVTNGAFYTSMGLLGATAGLAITGFVVDF